MKLTGAQALIKSLELCDTEVIFGLPGGCILPAYDPLLESSIRHILVRHEQGAGHMAEGYAHVTGRPGVAMVTSGPAATNMVTPLCDAYMDSVPMVCITGQVSRPAIGTDAFQECDTVGITRSVTKHNELIMSAQDIPRLVKEAFYLATTGRPGPVLLDLPKDVLQESMDWYWPDAVDLAGYHPVTEPDPISIRRAAEMILASHQPILYIGGGVLKARAAEPLLELAELCDIHVVTTLMARGAFPDSHRLALGMPGMHGNFTAIQSLQKSDLLINIGARFDDRVTGKVSAFAPGAKIIHADIDPAEHGKVRKPDVSLIGDARRVVEELLRAIKDLINGGSTFPDRAAWKQTISGWQENFPLTYEASLPGSTLKPQFVMERLRDQAPTGTILASGVGQHQMWASQYWKFEEPYTWVNSGGLGTMGFSVPAAIGAKVGRPRQDRVGSRRRWLLPDDQPRTHDCFHREDPGEDRHPQQLVAWHGASVAGDVLRRALLRDIAVSRAPRLRQAVRSNGLCCIPRRVAGRGRRSHRKGQRNQRPSSGCRFPYRRDREGLPDGSGRYEQRRPRSARFVV